MSYDDESNISYNNAFTPMILDVIALQEAYGEGAGTTGAGNDVIQAGTVGYRTYFDKGGIDTVDVSLYTSGCYLNMGTAIVGASHQVGVLTNIQDADNLFNGFSPASLRWLYGEYENVIGSPSFDIISGNSLNNNIQTGDGDDYVYGLGGNDIIDCGGGSADTCAYRLSRDNYSISYSNGVFTVTDLTGTEGTDAVTGVENFTFADQTLSALSFMDNTAPSIAVSSNTSFLIADSTATINFLLSETSTNFTVDDVTVSGGALSSFNGSGTSYSAIFRPTPNSTNNGVVSVASAQFTDLSGNSNADGADANNTLTFTVDSIAPTVTSFSPVDGLNQVAVDSNIVLTFNESIQLGNGTIEIREGASDGMLVESYSATNASHLSVSGAKLIINPSNNLYGGNRYFVVFNASAIQDLAGNEYLGTTNYDFTTYTDALRTFSPSYTLADTDPKNLIYIGLDNFTGIGNADNNRIVGNIGADYLDGRAGSDRLIGGAGDDTYVVDALYGAYWGTSSRQTNIVGDQVFERMSEGIDTVQTSLSYKLVNNVENLTLTGSLSVNGTGNKLNNTITGNAGNNLLWGGSGNDLLISGGGADKLYGGAGDDMIEVYLDGAGSKTMVDGGTGDDIISLQFKATSLASLADLLPSYFYHTKIAYKDYWVFTDGHQNSVWATNVFSKNTAGYWQGQAKIASRSYDLLNDSSIESLVSRPEYTGDNLMVWMYEGKYQFNLFAMSPSLNLSTSDNYYVMGTKNNDIITLGSGDDEIYGQDGNDTLEGGGGNNTLYGGAGNDIFKLDKDHGDNIADFNHSEDTIGLSRDTFTEFSGWASGTNIDISQFWSSSTGLAHDENDRVIYKTTTGELFYDADVNDSAPAFLLATLGTTSHPVGLDYTDFVLI